MKRATLMALALALGVSTAMAEYSKTRTIEGTLVDSKCFLMNPENAGNDHVTKMGIPASVLTAKGKVYILIVPAAQLADHIGEQVRATGKVKGEAFLAEKLEVKDGNTWKKVKITTMM